MENLGAALDPVAVQTLHLHLLNALSYHPIFQLQHNVRYREARRGCAREDRTLLHRG